MALKIKPIIPNKPPSVSTRPISVPTRPISVSTRPISVPTRPVGVPTRPVSVPTRPSSISTLVDTPTTPLSRNDLTKSLDSINKQGDFDINSNTTKRALNSENPIRTVSNTLNITQKRSLSGAKDWGVKSAKELYDNMRKNPKMWLGGALFSAISIIAIVAQANTDKINNTGYTIKTIQKDINDPKVVNITYEPAFVFTKDDTITITESNSSPSIDNIYRGNILKPGAGVFSLKLSTELQMDGNKGSFTVITEFADQFSKTVDDSVTQPIVTTSGDVIEDVTAEVVETSGNILENAFDSILPGFGQYWWVILLISSLIIFSSISSFGALYISSKK